MSASSKSDLLVILAGNYADFLGGIVGEQIGAAWSICQRHFEYPASSQVPEPGARGGFENFASGRTYSAEDEVPLDDFEAFEFFRYITVDCRRCHSYLFDQ
jgi:hypothetical protein